jgi:hypothetical protein
VPCSTNDGLAKEQWSLRSAAGADQISRITGMISGRREVFFTIKRFRS